MRYATVMVMLLPFATPIFGHFFSRSVYEIRKSMHWFRNHVSECFIFSVPQQTHLVVSKLHYLQRLREEFTELVQFNSGDGFNGGTKY